MPSMRDQLREGAGVLEVGGVAALASIGHCAAGEVRGAAAETCRVRFGGLAVGRGRGKNRGYAFCEARDRVGRE
jgi:hypothetical protein